MQSHDADGNVVCPVCDTPIVKGGNSHVDCMRALLDTLSKEELEELKAAAEDEEYKRHGIRDS